MMNETIFLGGCPVIRPEGIYLDGRRVIRLGLNDVGVGDLTCPGVDVDEWKKTHRVRLYPEQRHRWLFAVNSTSQTASELRAMFETTTFPYNPVFLRWFSWVALNPGGDSFGTAGKIDNTKMLAFGTKEDMIKIAAKAGLSVAQRAEDMRPLNVKEPKVYALVEFDYRSVDTSMPWPVFNNSTLKSKWCPIDADVALSVAFTQSADAAQIPKETSLNNPSTYLPIPSSETIEKAVADAAKAAAGAAVKAAPWGIIAAVVVGGALLVYYVPRRKQPLPPSRSTSYRSLPAPGST